MIVVGFLVIVGISGRLEISRVIDVYSVFIGGGVFIVGISGRLKVSRIVLGLPFILCFLGFHVGGIIISSDFAILALI